jgi:hypothetical protein
MSKSFTFTITVFLGITAFQSAGAQQPRAGILARDFNTQIQPINDAIDDLTKQLENPNMSMSDAAAIVNQQSSLRQKADDLWNSTQDGISDAFQQTGQQIQDYNGANRKLDYESAVIGTKLGILEGVAKYPTKDEFDRNKSQLSDQWENTYGTRLKAFGEEWDAQRQQMFKDAKERFGVDMQAEGYARIGTSNPYNDTAYYKYYGPDGKVLYAQWQNDADGWEKYRQDSDTFRRRQLELQDFLNKEARGLYDFDNQFSAQRAGTSSRLATIAGRVRKINFAGNWAGRDNVGNWVRLYLDGSGTMYWSWGRGGAVYNFVGSWSQLGDHISMNTNDGQWNLESTITQEYRLQFRERHISGRTYEEYLDRQ